MLKLERENQVKLQASNSPNMKSFKNWKRQEVEETFGVTEVKQHALLEDWVNHQATFTEQEKTRLEQLRAYLADNVDLWNEAELKMKFLAPLLELVNYDTPHYRAFMERPLSAKKGTEITTGIVDFLIARGRQLPRLPFFCIHEYKPDPSASNDPLGQLLIGLVAIYQSNQTEKHSFPVYGVYVIGKFFYFVVFDGKTYAKSDFFAAHQAGIFDIYGMLKKLKIYIERILG